MNNPRINNDDRGITLNKSLAWTMVVGLVAAGLWLGTETASTRGMVENLSLQQSERHAETLAQRRETDVRLRALETSRATQDSELTALRRDLTDFRSELREAVQLLRRIQLVYGGEQ